MGGHHHKKKSDSGKPRSGYSLWDFAAIALCVLGLGFFGYSVYDAIREWREITQTRERCIEFWQNIHRRERFPVDIPAEAVWHGGNAIELRVWNPESVSGIEVGYVLAVQYRGVWYVYTWWSRRLL